MDFETMLRDAMKQGKNLEDIMKNISTAANKIEKEQQAAKVTAEKYDVFNKPVRYSYQDKSNAEHEIIYTDKLNLHDVAIVISHFMCQNVPGYARALAKNGTDPVDLYQKLLESQMGAAKVFTDHQDDNDADKGKALFDHFFDEIFNDAIDKVIKDKKVGSTTKSNLGGKPQNSDTGTRNSNDYFKADVEKITKFLKDMGGFI